MTEKDIQDKKIHRLRSQLEDVLERLIHHEEFVEELYSKISNRSVVYSYEIKELMIKYNLIEDVEN